MIRRTRTQVALGAAAVALAGVAFVSWRGSASAAPRKFAPKSCVECHADMTQELRRSASTHPGVGEGTCESCHLRHGLVPKLLLRKEGNALCLECHTSTDLGLDKAHVHGALDGAGKCTA